MWIVYMWIADKTIQFVFFRSKKAKHKLLIERKPKGYCKGFRLLLWLTKYTIICKMG